MRLVIEFDELDDREGSIPVYGEYRDRELVRVYAEEDGLGRLLPLAKCESYGRAFDGQEAKAGFTECEHCAASAAV